MWSPHIFTDTDPMTRTCANSKPCIMANVHMWHVHMYSNEFYHMLRVSMQMARFDETIGYNVR